MVKLVEKRKTKKPWCPMEGTQYDGFCVENFATIKLKTKKCDHKEYCENLRKELDAKNENK